MDQFLDLLQWPGSWAGLECLHNGEADVTSEFKDFYKISNASSVAVGSFIEELDIIHLSAGSVDTGISSGNCLRYSGEDPGLQDNSSFNDSITILDSLKLSLISSAIRVHSRPCCRNSYRHGRDVLHSGIAPSVNCQRVSANDKLPIARPNLLEGTQLQSISIVDSDASTNVINAKFVKGAKLQIYARSLVNPIGYDTANGIPFVITGMKLQLSYLVLQPNSV